MNKIKLLNNISSLGTKLFEGKFQTTEALSDANLVVVRSAKMHEEKTDHLDAIARAGAGTNNIPSDRCADEGVVVFNTPGANANAVKELVLSAMLLSGRDIIGSIEWAKTLKGKGEEVSALVEKNKSNYTGREVIGKTLGVVGMGAIGGMVANVAIALGMQVIGYDPFLTADAASKLLGDIKITESLDELFSVSDFITIHVPLNDNTKNLIGKGSIPKLKKDVVIMNFSRGGLVDETEIIKAIESKDVAKYITDFPSDEVLGVDGIIALPHLGASTPEAEENCAIMAVNQLIDFAENGNIKNSVNYPDVSLGKKQGQRILVLFAGTEDDAKKIAGSLNIKEHKIAVRKNLGALLAEVDSMDEATANKIAGMEQVRRVRII